MTKSALPPGPAASTATAPSPPASQCDFITKVMVLYPGLETVTV